MNIPVPDNGIPIKLGDSSYVYKGVYHPITWVNNLPYRPRVETLVIKDGTMVYLRLKTDKGSSGIKGNYELPGGSIDADATKLKQAENEVNEETLMSIKDIYDAGIQYYEDYPNGFIMGGGDTPLEYKGHISDVFVAQYSGIYDMHNVEKKDLDPKIANNGKFYRIMDIAKILKKEHCEAILNCPYVKPSMKASLRILNQMMNSISKINLKDISSSEITDTVIIVSPYDKLTQVPVSPAGKEKDWKKISVFRSVKNAVEDFFTTMNGKLMRYRENYANKILYVYAVDEPYKELSLYTPSNEEAPCGKITGELWLKSSLNNVSIRRLGMIQATSTGKSSQFYSGIHNSNVYNVPEYTFKWIVRDIVENAVAESASPIVPGNKLYHGTTYEISKFEPRSLNLGNAMEEPSWVTFAFADYTLALRFGLMRAIQKAKDYWGKDILCSWDISEAKPYISAEDFNKVNDLIQGFKFFVYTIDTTNLNVGIGNDDRLQEYTFSNTGITPEKEDALRIDASILKEHLIIVPNSEFKDYKKNQETMAKYEHPRGWYGAFMTRDYNNGDASHKLQSAVWDGDLNPGDDIREYMNIHGLSFDDDSVNLSSVNESTYYRVTYDGIGIYDAVRTSVDHQTWVNLLNDAAITWLPKPPQYMSNNKSYFTKAGYDIFTRKTLPLLKNYVDPRKIQVSAINDIGRIAYKDGYQVVVSEATKYDSTPMKSIFDKDFKKKTQLKLSIFKKLKINQLVVNKYKHKTKALQNMEPTEGGYVFVDGEEFVAVVVVDTDRSGTGDLKDYNWITYLEVDKKYQGHGLSHQLLDIAVKELKGDFLTVTYNNEIAINLYKSYGFKITKSSYDEIKSGKSKSHMYTMFYSKNAPNNIEFVNESIQPVTESLFISKGVFDVNFEDFKSGKSNVVLITGLSGSGKTTLGTKIASEYNAELIELDCFERCYQFETDEQLQEAGEVFWQYLSKRKVLWDKLKERSIRGKELGGEINKFVKFAISWCKSDTKTKYVIEGVQIYSFLNKEKISGTPLLIVGTSALKSLVQRLGRVKRENSKEEFKRELSELPQCIAWYLDDNKKLEKFKKSVLESADQEIYVSEAAEYSSTNKYPVFITLMHTGTATATFIKKMTGDEFSHATISFNMRLSPQYSFGTKKLGGKDRGLVIHGTRDPFYDQFKTTYATYVMYVSKQQREKMLTRLQWFIDHEETLKYDAPALAACFFHIPTEFRKKYFCSRFVMEIIGEGQELSKVLSLWKPQEITYLNNITLVNAGDDFRHYDYKVTQTNLNLIKENRQNEIHVDMPVSESTRSELPDNAFGLPEHRKYPLDTEEHVTSAIKFFNYVSKEDEEELAKNILTRIEELGMNQPAVTERNRFIKYIEESYLQMQTTTKNRANWSLINTLDDEERKKVLKITAPYMNSPVIYVNNTFVGRELAGTINVFRDSDKEDFGHVFIVTNPKFINFQEIYKDLLYEAELEFTNPIWGISSYEVNYPENQLAMANPVQESCKDVKTAREFLQKVDKLGEKYNANFFIVTDGASMTRNNRGSNPAVQHCRNAQKEWERKNGFDPDEDWLKDKTLESANIFEEGQLDEYAKYANLDNARNDVDCVDESSFEDAMASSKKLIDTTKAYIKLRKDMRKDSSLLEHKLNLGLTDTSEIWTPLTEAPKAIDKDSTGDSTDDYTADIEDPDGDTPEDDSNSKEEEPTDYTNDVEEPKEDPDDKSDNSEDNKDNDLNEDFGDLDMDMEEPTDYTSDTEGNTTDTNTDSSDNNTSDSSETDNIDKSGNLFDNNVLKNYSLLRNFEKLYELIKEVSDSLDAKVEPTKLQNMVLAQVLKNLNFIKEFIISYVKFQFSQDNYSQNLYYYNIVVHSLKLNLKLLERNHLLGESK